MPAATYEKLLADAMPVAIETDERYEKIGRRFGDLLGKAKKRTPEETKLMRLLSLLVEDYQILRFLMEHSGKSASDLLPVFGQRSHVNEALNGKRPVSAEQASKLRKLFSVKPGLFI